MSPTKSSTININDQPKKIGHIHVFDRNNKGDYAIVLAVQELLRKEFSNCIILDFPVETLKQYDKNNLNLLNSCDLIFIGGGGIFYSYFLPFNLDMITAITSPIFLFGLGYIKEVDAPLWPENYRKSVLNLANKAKMVGVRDINTQRFLTEQGFPYEKISVIGDPAALLKEVAPTQGELERLKLTGEKIRVGFNLNYSGWLGFGIWREDILKAYRETAQYFIDNYDAQIYYLKHHPGEENIYQELKIENIIKVDLEPATQKYVYSRLDLVIGMMLHVGVMSFGALTPEISVAYDIRNYGFAEFIKCPELVVDLDKLKKGVLLARAKDVFSKKTHYQGHFNSEKERIAKLERNFLKMVN